MATWLDYSGSDEQICEIKSAEHGVMFWYIADYGIDRVIYRYKDNRYHIDNRIETKVISKYLICEPHPYADVIDIWRLTGCEVWSRYEWRDSTGPHSETYVTDEPNWNIPGAEYRLTPFEEEV